jgi:aspartate aminotransferase
MGFSDIVRIRNRVLELRQQGATVLQFEGGEPFAHTPDFVKEAMKRAIDENHTRYAPSSGVPVLVDTIRQKLEAKNQIRAGIDDIIVTAGGMHALFCAFEATLNHDEETLVFSPYWTPIKDLVTFCGGRPLLVPWSVMSGSDPAAALEGHLTPRTKLIYLNSPANPTGYVFSRLQLEAIARVAIERNLIVISDEAYEDFVYGAEHISIASLPGMATRTITCFTLSKTYSMTGWRVGYAVADATWMEPMRRLVLNSVNGVSTPTQHAAVSALADHPQYLAQMRAEYLRRRDLLVAGMNGAGFRCTPPEGAFYLFVDARERLGGDSWAAMNTLLDRTGIATVPGVVFGPHGEGHLRMSFSTSIETIEKAVDALRKL